MVFSQYGLACKYGIIFQISIYDWAQKLHFLIPGITIANQARLKQKLDLIYFLIKKGFWLVCILS